MPVLDPAASPPAVGTALVTGAGRGIGRAIAVALASAGHRVALTARSVDELTETQALCRSAAGQVAASSPTAGTVTIVADLTAPGAVDDVFARTEDVLGPVDILVANAGTAITGPIARITDEDWQRQLDLNLTAPFRCLRRAVPAMVRRRYGRIVVIGSVASRQGAPYLAGYVASKHGVLGLVRAAAAELARTGVTVNAVCPGFVDTPMTEASIGNIVARTGRTPSEARATLAGRQPSNRLIDPAEVAAAVLFCVANPAVNGQGINIDGGTVQS